MEGYQWGGRGGRMREKVQGIRSINGIGNVEAKELICMTHGYEPRGKNAGGVRVQGRGEQWGEKKWDNCDNQ